MPPLTQDYPTFGHYAFDLREGLRKSANNSLVELDQAVNTKGHDWLNDYMTQIFGRVNQGPIGDLIKTPSKTQTVKKTRAATAAAREKTERIKDLNAQLVLSPSKQVSRPALSPLQFGARGANVRTSPSPSPLKPKSKAATPVKPKPKRVRSKKAEVADENKPLLADARSMPQATDKPSSRNNEVASEMEETSVKMPKEKSKSSRANKTTKQSEVESQGPSKMVETDRSPEIVEDDNLSYKTVSQEEASEDQGMDVDSATVTAKSQQPGNVLPKPVNEEVSEPDVPPLVESVEAEKVQALEEASVIKRDSEALQQQHDKGIEEAPIKVKDGTPIGATNDSLDAVGPTAEETAQEPAANGVAKESNAEGAMESSTADLMARGSSVVLNPSTGLQSMPLPQSEVATIPDSVTNPTDDHLPSIIKSSSGAPMPVRQVRSSWLSKALGTGTLPLSAPTEPGATLRKSYAAPSQQIAGASMDFSGLRKSLVPIGGLKRKSDEGLDEEEEEDDKREHRPEKLAKTSESQTIHFPTTTPGPVGRPKLPSKTPSFGTGSVSEGRPDTVWDDTHRPEISKVTKALDELREKKAKDAAKQKASSTVRSDSGSARVPLAKSTGAGFLRGLFNYGAVSEEEEAERRAREMEEERLAEEELEKLMWDATKPTVEPEATSAGPITQTVVSTGEGKTSELHKITAPRSTTPPFSPPLRQPVIVEPSSDPTDGEDEEMVDEESVLDEIIPGVIPESARPVVNLDGQSPPAELLASTTPMKPPPISSVSVVQEPPALHDRQEKHSHEPSADLKQKHREEEREKKKEIEQELATQRNNESEKRRGEEDARRREAGENKRKEEAARAVRQGSDLEEELNEDLAVSSARTVYPKLPSSSTSANMLQASTSSVATTSTLSHASTMASKVLGVKPAAGPVKSLQLAAAAAKKEQVAAGRKAAMKDQADKRKGLLALKKADEERTRAEEERKTKVAELEEKRRLRAEHEKRKKEREVRVAAIAKEKAVKEEKEMQAAKAKQAEEEAARKRKLAVTLNKSQTGAPAAKRVAGASQSAVRGKEPFRPTKSTSAHPLSASYTEPKMGPTSFRTAETAQASSLSITLVKQPQVDSQPEKKALGQPSRPSAMEKQALRQSYYQNQLSAQRSSAVPQTWAQVQSSLDEKAAMQQSEDIVLPDIASEYSDPDDDTPRDFNRPAWAESPELRKALEAQAHINPDELFGPIKPLNMDELFKARAGKFRARTSSGNWSRGDGLTKSEEAEYARRMGFTSLAYYDEAGGSSRPQ